MTDSDRERIIDRRVKARLANDAAYRNAADADAAASREAEIEAEETAMLDRTPGVEADPHAERMLDGRSAAFGRTDDDTEPVEAELTGEADERTAAEADPELEPLVSSADAAVIVAADVVFAAIAERARYRAFRTPSSGVSVRAQDLGALAAYATQAGQAAFMVLNVASSYCEDPGAAAELDRRFDR